jgi:hypothetical protein
MSEDAPPAGSESPTGSTDRAPGLDSDCDPTHDRNPATGDGVQSSELIAAVDDVEFDTAVPSDAPVHRCAYCDRPFAEESYLVLHRGLVHADVLSTPEREAFEAAYAEEESDLRRFRIVALGLLVLLYFGFLFTFAVVT